MRNSSFAHLLIHSLIQQRVRLRDRQKATEGEGRIGNQRGVFPMSPSPPSRTYVVTLVGSPAGIDSLCQDLQDGTVGPGTTLHP